MKILDMLSKVEEIHKGFVDDKSKQIYDIWLKYFTYRDIEDLRDDLMDVNNGFYEIPFLDRYANLVEGVEYLVLFGAGRYGKRTYKLLKKSKWGGIGLFFATITPWY